MLFSVPDQEHRHDYQSQTPSGGVNAGNRTVV
jgi:hypothetical protein